MVKRIEEIEGRSIFPLANLLLSNYVLIGYDFK